LNHFSDFITGEQSPQVETPRRTSFSNKPSWETSQFASGNAYATRQNPQEQRNAAIQQYNVQQYTQLASDPIVGGVIQTNGALAGHNSRMAYIPVRQAEQLPAWRYQFPDAYSNDWQQFNSGLTNFGKK
jgi:hypothetical protein